MSVATAEPERELIRRISPFALPVVVAAFVIGALTSGAPAGWSAAIAITVVFVNFLANAYSVAWAAAISPVLLYAVSLGGFILRIGIIVAIIALLNQLAWFSIAAFLGALVPSTVALIGFEMKLLAGRMQADMWNFPAGTHEVGP